MIQRRSRPRKRSTGGLPGLINQLDVLFAAYVKDRDGDTCVTCGTAGLTGSNWHAGHFIRRGNKALRFDPKNCHSQCGWVCNKGKRGAPREYAFYLLDRYGEAEFRRLMQRKSVLKKWTRPELERLIEAIRKGPAEYEMAYYEAELS